MFDKSKSFLHEMSLFPPEMFSGLLCTALYRREQMEYNEINHSKQEDVRLHIAICDDNAQELKQLAGLMDRFAAENGADVPYHTFTDAEEMLAAAASRPFSHYFLDVIMLGMDGMTAAQEIRQRDADAKIIFLTASRDYAYQSYRVKAYDYLLKPVDVETLFALLRELLALEEKAEECLCLQNGHGLFRIPFRRISHVEVNQKKLYFHLTDGQVQQLSGTMAEVEQSLLSQSEFFKIHRSYIVNVNQIAALSPDGCIMFSGQNLPVSRLLYQQVRRRVMSHLFSKEV